MLRVLCAESLLYWNELQLQKTFPFLFQVKLFETFCSETRIYLVMEYADSGDLLEFINSKPHGLGIGEDKSRSFFKQLVQGMEYCHNQNVVHRSVADIILHIGIVPSRKPR